MPGTLSDYLELKLLDHVFGAAAYTPPVTLYVALYTAAPTDAGGGTEVAGGSYARQAITNNATNFPAAAAGLKSNGTAISFPAATGTWGLVVAAALMDAASGGNQLGWGTLAVSKQIDPGDTFVIPIGDLDITLD